MSYITSPQSDNTTPPRPDQHAFPYTATPTPARADAPNGTIVKVSLSVGDVRRFRVVGGRTRAGFVQVKDWIHQHGGSTVQKITYNDKDGDAITICTHDDWAEAVDVAEGSPVRIAVTTTGRAPVGPAPAYYSICDPQQPQPQPQPQPQQQRVHSTRQRGAAAQGTQQVWEKPTRAFQDVVVLPEATFQHEVEQAIKESQGCDGGAGIQHTLGGKDTLTATMQVPRWCVRGGRAVYRQSGAACTIIGVDPPMPGDCTTYVSIVFDGFGGGSCRETVLANLAPLSATTAVAPAAHACTQHPHWRHPAEPTRDHRPEQRPVRGETKSPQMPATFRGTATPKLRRCKWELSHFGNMGCWEHIKSRGSCSKVHSDQPEMMDALARQQVGRTGPKVAAERGLLSPPPPVGGGSSTPTSLR
jgi:hypothetical protein